MNDTRIFMLPLNNDSQIVQAERRIAEAEKAGFVIEWEDIKIEGVGSKMYYIRMRKAPPAIPPELTTEVEKFVEYWRAWDAAEGEDAGPIGRRMNIQAHHVALTVADILGLQLYPALPDFKVGMVVSNIFSLYSAVVQSASDDSLLGVRVIDGPDAGKRAVWSKHQCKIVNESAE